MKLNNLFRFSRLPASKRDESFVHDGSSKPLTAQVEQTQAPSNNGFSGVVTQQTLEYLRQVELDDVLELMYPRLIIEQQNRLAGCNRELEEIDRELARLYTSRDDVQGVMNLDQTPDHELST